MTGVLGGILGGFIAAALASRYGEKKAGHFAAVLCLFIAFSTAGFAWFYLTGPLDFVAQVITVASAEPIRDGPTIRIRSVDGESFRLVDGVYDGLYNRPGWSRDEILEQLTSGKEVVLWTLPGRDRVQGVEAAGLHIDPSIGKAVERDQRKWAWVLPGLFLLLGLGGLFSRDSSDRIATGGVRDAVA